MRSFYLFGFIPFFIYNFLFLVLPISFTDGLFFNLTYFWHFSLTSPQLEEYVSKASYRFSFLRLVYNLDCWLEKLFTFKKYPGLIRLIRRQIPSLLFVMVIWYFTTDGKLIFAFVGHLAYGLSSFLEDKFKSRELPSAPME